MSGRREACRRLRALIESAEWARAGRLLTRLRERYPRDAALCGIEGIYWARRGYWSPALRRFQCALAWDREDANTVFNLGVTWCRLGAPVRGRLLMDLATAQAPSP
jgi:Flp pilus assembly protein TadD